MERLTRGGAALSFADVGKGAPPILLIHDLGSNHTSWRPSLECFRNRHRVVAVDLPRGTARATGCGSSTL